MMIGDFRKDLEASDESTKGLVSLLEDKGLEEFSLNTDYRYDIFCRNKAGKVITIEYKHDIRAIETGNVAIEYESREKLSGILHTEAGYWIQKIGDSFYMIKVDKLKNLLIYYGNVFRRVRGGDNGTSLLILIPIEVFIKNSNKI
jgi:hypothetical protein